MDERGADARRSPHFGSEDGGPHLSTREAWDALYLRRPLPWGSAPWLPEIPRGARVLELGCGGGRVLSVLSARIRTDISWHREKEGARWAFQVGAGGAVGGLLSFRARAPVSGDSGGSPREMGPAPEAGEGPMLVGLDFSISALKPLLRRGTWSLVLGDATELPFRSQSFDLVFCRHLLEHLEEEGRRRTASEMLRVLADGGRAWVTVFSVDDARFGKGREVERGTFLRGDGILRHYFTGDELRSLFGPALTRCRSIKWRERAGRERVERAVIEAEVERRRA
ncbi:MAG: class I SAM-dependent methyltransferase [Thermoplasmata archaeon]